MQCRPDCELGKELVRFDGFTQVVEAIGGKGECKTYRNDKSCEKLLHSFRIRPNAIIALFCKNYVKTMMIAYPKITAFQNMILLSHGAPLIPAGGS